LQLLDQTFIPVHRGIGKAVGYHVDAFADGPECALAVVPSEDVIAVRRPAACGFHEGQTRKQAPIQFVGVGFIDKYRRQFLERRIHRVEKTPQTAETRIVFPAFVSMCRLFGQRNSCWNCYKTCRHHKTLLKQFLHLKTFRVFIIGEITTGPLDTAFRFGVAWIGPTVTRRSLG